MLITPTKGRIYFAEFDVMKSAEASLRVAYSKRAHAAGTAAEQQWWEARRQGLRAFVRDAVDTDREDLVQRTRMMREELKRIGGLKAPGQKEDD